MKRISAVLALLILSSGLFTAGAQAVKDERSIVLDNVERFGRAILNIHNHYIDTVNYDRLVDDAIKTLMNNLDPHSTFIPKDEVESANESLRGDFEGVGVEFAIIKDTITIQSVIAGGPSDAVGLMAGDKFLKIDSEKVAGIGINNDGVRSRLRGKGGTKVELEVLRRGSKEPLHYTVTRGRVPLNSVDAVYSPADGIVYIKLSRFASTSAMEVMEAIYSLDEYPSGVILDLRGNSGGYLNVAIALANQFLGEGERIVFTEGRTSKLRQEYASGTGFYMVGPLALIVDDGSASASEILAGAVQDWDRGVIVGRRTFGKGLVQQLFNLPDGSQMRLTVARYHTPNGRVIQSPYQDGHRDDYYERINSRYGSGELFSADSIVFADSLKFSTLKLGRTVYGGGGIMPDIFVPEDTTGVNEWFAQSVRSGNLTDYSNIFCDRHRDEIVVEGRSFEEFYEAYKSLEDEAFNGFVDYCVEHGAKRDKAQITECKALVKTRLKALAAKVAFGTTGYYRVINMEEDPEFTQALKVVTNWSGTFPSL